MTDVAYPRRDGVPPMVRGMVRYPNLIRSADVSPFTLKDVPTVTVTMEIPRDLYNGTPRWRVHLRSVVAFARKWVH